MKLSDYIRLEKVLGASMSRDKRLDAEAEVIFEELKKENAQTGGRRYPTGDSMFLEAIKRADRQERERAAAETK